MSKLTQKEFMDKAKAILGDRTDDEAISFLEDCKDTISSEGDDWKVKYDALAKEKEELDASWRKKYTDRFFDDDANNNNTNNKETNEHTNPLDTRSDEQKKAESITVDDLFTREE